MNRLVMNFLRIAGGAVAGAVFWALVDYYDVLFGHSHRSSWNVVEHDTAAGLESRALWGALGGVVVGVVLVIQDLWKHRDGKSDERSDDQTSDD